MKPLKSGVAPCGSPVSLYLKLPGDTEATFIHGVLPTGAEVLEFGCGAGRVTRHLVALGHRVTGVDHSREMLAEVEKIPNTETVLSDLADLDLSPRRWPVVLLASHLINEARGREFLESAVRHVAPDGCILIQRWEPGRIDSVQQSRTERPGLTIEMQNIQHPEPGVLRATMIYEVDDEHFEQEFTAYELDDDRLGALAPATGCEVDEVLGKHRSWIRLRPIALGA